MILEMESEAPNAWSMITIIVATGTHSWHSSRDGNIEMGFNLRRKKKTSDESRVGRHVRHARV